MKPLFRNKYMSVRLITGLAFGVGYDDQELLVLLGCFGIEIHIWAFKPSPKNKPTVF